MSEHFNVTGRRQAQSWQRCRMLQIFEHHASPSSKRSVLLTYKFLCSWDTPQRSTFTQGSLRPANVCPDINAQRYTEQYLCLLCTVSRMLLCCCPPEPHSNSGNSAPASRRAFEHYLLFSFALSWADSLFTSSASQWGILYWGQGQNSLENSEEFLFQNKVPWSRSVDFPFGCCKSFETRNNKQTPNQSSRSCFPFGEKGRRCHNLP